MSPFVFLCRGKLESDFASNSSIFSHLLEGGATNAKAERSCRQHRDEQEKCGAARTQRSSAPCMNPSSTYYKILIRAWVRSAQASDGGYRHCFARTFALPSCEARGAAAASRWAEMLAAERGQEADPSPQSRARTTDFRIPDGAVRCGLSCLSCRILGERGRRAGVDKLVHKYGIGKEPSPPFMCYYSIQGICSDSRPQ